MSTLDRNSLFTPGPLNCSPQVHAAMQRDIGSRETSFIETVARIRRELLKISGLSETDGYTAVPMQGSGTFAIESALTTMIGSDDRLLVMENGAYGKRMIEIAQRAGLCVECLSAAPTEYHNIDALDALLKSQPELSHVAVVHCETTTGILNPLSEIAAVVKANGRRLLVDAMSSFGALPIDFQTDAIECLIASPNKCLESAPGFGFAIVKEESLRAAAGRCPSLSLDLHAQWAALEANGQFRFTPPTHCLLAFDKALQLLADEGGVSARYARYQKRHQQLIAGMAEIGFTPVLAAEKQSPIITAFPLEGSPFSFDQVYEALAEEGLIIYPGKLEKMDCFRIGNIGQLEETDINRLIQSIARLQAT